MDSQITRLFSCAVIVFLCFIGASLLDLNRNEDALVE